MGARCLWMLVALMFVTATSDAAELRIRYAETVQPQVAVVPGSGKISRGETLAFTAYGRAFQFDVEQNARVLRSLSPQKQQQLGVTPYKGSLAGIVGSWVRITRIGAHYSGAIWDGNDLYVLAPAAEVASAVESPLSVDSDDTLIFRLRDAEGGALDRTCGAAASSAVEANSNERYRALVGELKGSAPIMQAATLTGEFEVSVLADSFYTRRFTGDPTATILAYMNVVDGIFSEQVGVIIVPVDLTLFNAGNEPFTSSIPNDLLSELRSYRVTHPGLQTRSITHLLTGRDLDGETIGVGYIRGVCSPNWGASLSQAESSWMAPLIIAHELGHNFGAPHDNEANSPCASTSNSFLMNPRLNSSDQFSACSLQQMAPVIAGASCQLSPHIADASVSFDTSALRVAANHAYSFPVTIRSNGNVAAEDVVLTVATNAGSLGTVQSVTAPGDVTCGNSLPVSCRIDDLPAGESREIIINATAPSVQQVTSIIASVTASVDRNSDNDSQTLSLTVFSGSDVSITASAPAGALVGDPFDVTLDASASGIEASENVVVRLNVPSAFVIDSASAPGVACAVNVYSISCPLGTLQVGEQRRVVARVRAQSSGGPFSLSASIGSNDDVSTPNNFANISVTVDPRLDVGVTAPATLPIQIVGVPFDYSVDVAARGVESATNVTFSASLGGLQVQQVTATSGSCQINDSFVSCALGTLAPGMSQRITFSLLATQAVSVGTGYSVIAPDDDFWGNNAINRVIEVRYRADLQIASNAGAYGVEGIDTLQSVLIESVGAEPASNITVRAVLPDDVLIAAATLLDVPCAIVGATIECSVATLEPNRTAWLRMNVAPPHPGSFAATINVSASNDVNPANNQQNLNIWADPLTDVRIDSAPERISARAGEIFSVPVVIATDRQPIFGVTFDVSGLSNMTVQSITAPDGGSCRVQTGGIRCMFGELAANATRRVDISVRVNDDVLYPPTAIQAYVYGMSDRKYDNNSRSIAMDIVVPGDAAVSVASPNITAIRGETFTFPAINVTGLRTLDNVVLTLALPTGISVVTTNGACSLQDSALRCPLGVISTGTTYSLSVTARADSMVSSALNVQLSAPNDQDAQNNTASVTLNVQERPSSGGGKGGGGAMPLHLLLGLLLLYLTKRHTRFGCR